MAHSVARNRAALQLLARQAGATIEGYCYCHTHEATRSFSAAARELRPSPASWRVQQPSLHTRRSSASASASIGASGAYMQSRSFSWAFWRRSEPQGGVAEVPAEAPVDLELVDTIVQMAGPASMDALTRQMLHAGVWWPPTYIAESILATAHDALGLSWLVAVPLTVVLMRSLMAPLHIMVQKQSHNMAKASPLLQDAQKDMMLAMERGVSAKDAQERYAADMQRIMAENRTGPLSMFYPMLVQLPVFTGYYFALSEMCKHHLPSMLVDCAKYGFDMTVADPNYIAPLGCMSTIMLAMYLSLSYRWKILPPEQQQMAKYGVFVAPVVLTGLFSTFPVALCYYWTCSNLYTVCMELVLRHGGVRAAVGLPSIAEQAELALNVQRRKAAGGQIGMMEVLRRQSAAAANQVQQEQQALLGAPQTHPTAAAAPRPPAPVVQTSAAARFAKKKRHS